MKILVISDIHANYHALEKLFSEIDKADLVLCLGDIIGYYHDVNEVTEYIRNNTKIITIRGNHDNYLWDCPLSANEKVKQGIEFANANLSQINKDWIQQLPYFRVLKIDGLSVLMVHGSPWDYSNEYLYPDNPNILKLLTTDYDVVFFGHTHRPMLLTRNGKFAANPGSVGQSRHLKNYVSAIWWNSQTFETSFVSIPLQ